MEKTKKRGALITFEGTDKSGKTTQSHKLMEYLVSQSISAERLSFPDRTTPIGQLIDRILKKEVVVTNKSSLYLLFTANRHELQHKMVQALYSGVTLVVDRYLYSGIAYGVANGLRPSWCKFQEKSFLWPDLVIYLDCDGERAAERSAFGTELFERADFQAKVRKNFLQLHKQAKEKWLFCKATEDADTIARRIEAVVEQIFIVVDVLDTIEPSGRDVDKDDDEEGPKEEPSVSSIV